MTTEIAEISCDHSQEKYFIDNQYFPFEQVAQTITSVWNHIYGGVEIVVCKIYYVTRSTIGVPFRDLLFFPLCLLDIPVIKSFLSDATAQLQIEETYSRDFWNVEKPLDLNFPLQGLIRTEFNARDHTIPLRTEDGRSVQMTCRIIESKGLKDAPAKYTFVLTPGIFGSYKTQSAGMYPYIAAYLKERAGETSSARFIILSQNDMQEGDPPQFFRPSTLEEGGALYYQAIQSLQNQFGKIDQLTAHSLGCLFAGGALKYFKEEELPTHICLDRGPTSVWEMGKRSLMRLGWTLYPLAKFSGWTLDLEQEIADLCKRTDKPSIVISGVKQDHYFYGSANLCLSPKIQALSKTGRLQAVMFDVPLQVGHEFSHHTFGADRLHAGYLVGDSLQSEELGNRNLAEWIVSKQISSTNGRMAYETSCFQK